MEKVETTLGNLQTALSALDELAQKPLPPKTAYRVAKLRKLVKNEVDSLDEIRKKADSYIEEFERKRMELLFEYADKTEEGLPVIQGSQVVISDEEKRKEFADKLEELREEYKENIESYEQAQKELEELMDEVQEFHFPLLSIESLPDHVEVSAETIEKLDILLKE